MLCRSNRVRRSTSRTTRQPPSIRRCTSSSPVELASGWGPRRSTPHPVIVAVPDPAETRDYCASGPEPGSSASVQAQAPSIRMGDGSPRAQSRTYRDWDHPCTQGARDANIRSCHVKGRSCMPTSMRSSVGGAARRSTPARAARDRGRRGRARSQLPGESLRRADRETEGQARRRRPQAIVVAPRFSAYTEASRAMFRVFEDARPTGRRSLDPRNVPGCPRDAGRPSGTPVEIAKRLRRDVRERVGLPITVGVARTKFLAKLRAASPSPTACSWCLPIASSPSCTRSRSSGFGVSGR